MVEVIPGILEQSFDEIRRKIDLVKDYVSCVQIDVLDNTLIHNDTYINFPAFKIFQDIKLEAHLMVADPLKYIKPLVENGFSRLIAHVEGNSVRDFIITGHSFEIEVGVALDSPSPLEMVEPYLSDIDTVLLMMYKAGASGQEFQPEMLPKIKKLHQAYPDLPIEVDGGINEKTALLTIENGATRLVSTSYLFWENKDRMEQAIQSLEYL